jgi:lactoylglutathione lyase
MFRFIEFEFDGRPEFIDRYFIFVIKIIYGEMHIDHIAIWTENLENEKDFYLKYFECKANEKYINPVKQYSSYFLNFTDGSRIELMQRADIKEGRAGDTLGIAHIAFNAGSREKVDYLTGIFEKEGVTIVSRPRVTGDGYYESVILDPENNVIEIICHI